MCVYVCLYLYVSVYEWMKDYSIMVEVASHFLVSILFYPPSPSNPCLHPLPQPYSSSFFRWSIFTEILDYSNVETFVSVPELLRFVLKNQSNE
jgi:hypothetical protein